MAAWSRMTADQFGQQQPQALFPLPDPCGTPDMFADDDAKAAE